jgi:hypothetical protein
MPPNLFGPKKLAAYAVVVTALVLFGVLSRDPAEIVGFAAIMVGLVALGLGLLGLMSAVVRLEGGSTSVRRDRRAGGASSRGPADTLVRRPKTTRRVNYLRIRLYDGFEEEGRDGLVAVVHDTSAPSAERSSAAIVLGWWHMTRAETEWAHEFAEIAHVLDGELASAELVALKADVLVGLGRTAAARLLLQQYERFRVTDLGIRLANVEPSDDPVAHELHVTGILNEIYSTHDLRPVRKRDGEGPLTLSSLEGVAPPRSVSGPTVSVIMPMRNAERTLPYALGSVLQQTWADLEIIVVDDGSTDSSAAIAERYSMNDPRIKLVGGEALGAYPARNTGVQWATGEYITVHDADDWSHPEKIERQMVALRGVDGAVASISSMVRVTDDLRFVYRGSKAGLSVIGRNTSSLLVRRAVVDQLGAWDHVRVGADGEYLERVVSRFGKAALITVAPGVPLSLCLSTTSSLSTSGPTSVAAQWPSGSRFLYSQSYRAWHSSPRFPSDLPVPIGARAPFTAPALYVLEPGNGLSDDFDVVIVTDLSLTGGTYSSTEQEVLAHTRAGLRTGLVHLPIVSGHPINRKVFDLVNGKDVALLSFGQQVRCAVAIIRHPGVLESPNQYMPNLVAEHVIVVVNQTPRVSYSPLGREVYRIPQCSRSVKRMGLPEPVWYPLSPAVRDVLVTHHRQELDGVTLSPDDWRTVIDADWWKRRTRRPSDGKIRLGRHSRDGVGKWPTDAASLRAAYPSTDPFEIHVLGGAAVPTDVLGQLPKNWTVHGFDELSPREFLAELDVYVFFTASGVEEAFGRSVLEALAVGVPVIAPPSFERAFGSALIYAEPNEVRDRALSIMSNEDSYTEQVERGFRFVAEWHSWEIHLRRLEPFLSGRLTAADTARLVAET